MVTCVSPEIAMPPRSTLSTESALVTETVPVSEPAVSLILAAPFPLPVYDCAEMPLIVTVPLFGVTLNLSVNSFARKRFFLNRL